MKFVKLLKKNIFNVVTILISVIGITISVGTRRDSQVYYQSLEAEREPKFSLYFAGKSKNKNGVSGSIYKFHNEGGQLVCPSLKVHLYMYIKYNMGNGESSVYKIELDHFYPEQIKYEVSESSFIMKETKYKKVKNFVQELLDILDEEKDFDLLIEEISLKKLFIISYKNYLGKKETTYFSNNFESYNRNYYERFSRESHDNIINKTDIDEESYDLSFSINESLPHRIRSNYSAKDPFRGLSEGGRSYPPIDRNLSKEENERIFRKEFIEEEIFQDMIEKY